MRCGRSCQIAHTPPTPERPFTGFSAGGAPQLDDALIARLKAPNEEIAITGQTVWLHAPEGIGRSKLAAKLDFGVPTTARNLNTLTMMVAMLDGTA